MISTFKTSRHGAGFSLIELMVTITILVLLLLAALPLVNDWIYSAQTREARSKLVQSYNTAKALALRNPNKAATSAVAAGLRVVTNGNVSTLLVCKGDPANAACVVNGSNLQWQAELAASVVIAIAGVTATALAPQTISINNHGLPSSATTYTVSRGGSQNNETGTLY